MDPNFHALPTLEEVVTWYEAHVPRLVFMLTMLALVALAYFVVTHILKKRLSRHAKNEREMANVRVFLRLWRYFFVFVLFLVLIISYTQSLTALGLSAGFLGMALGWALQTPIVGVAAWLMVLIKKPFAPGDRVIIDGIEGDVYDITVSHIYLEEYGGTTSDEERSGRFIMIPTGTLWTAKVVNFTLNDDYVLKEVPITITYESNLKKAIKILHEAAMKHAKDAIKTKKIRPVERINFLNSSVEIRLKYFVHVRNQAQTASAIRQEIFENIRKAKDVEIAYPHMQVVLGDKTAPAKNPLK